MKKKIGIIGAGLSGLGATWALKETDFDVTIFEASDSIGGHFHSIKQEVEGEVLNLEIGSGGFFDPYYNLLAFCYQYGLNIRRNTTYLYHPPFDEQLRPEYIRFCDELKQLYLRGSLEEIAYATILEYCQEHGYNDAFIYDLLLPMLNDYYEESTPDVLNFSMALLIESWNFQVVSLDGPINMLMVAGGTDKLLEVFNQLLKDNIRLSTPIKKVERQEEHVLVKDAKGNKWYFDEVICTTAFNITAQILADPTSVEQNLFKKFEPRKISVCVHTDHNMVPPDELEAHRNAVFFHHDTVTLDLGQYCLNKPRKVYRTHVNDQLNGHLDPDKIIMQHDFYWERFTPDSLTSKTYVHNIQGKDRIWYGGISTVIPYGECCFLSGLAIANALGANYPFEHLKPAKALFDKVQKLMFKGETNMYLFGNY